MMLTELHIHYPQNQSRERVDWSRASHNSSSFLGDYLADILSVRANEEMPFTCVINGRYFSLQVDRLDIIHVR